jgi:quercetin dioxygenase-like cupin family protein
MPQPKDWFVAIGGVVLLGAACAVAAQNSAPNPGVQRTDVTSGDISVPGREAVMVHVVLAPGAAVGWHTHPGEEITYVSDGAITLMLAGQAPRRVAAGEGVIVPMGTVHNARNDGTVAAKLVVVYVVEKGKPIRTAAPEPGG